MEKLERLCLVSKVATQLHHHLGIGDKDLAEFIIHLGEKSSCLDDFQAEVSANGAELSSSLCESLYLLILNFTKKLRKAAPTKDEKKTLVKKSQEISINLDEDDNLKNDKSKVEGENGRFSHVSAFKDFPALSIPNSESTREELQLDRPDEGAALSETAKQLLEDEKTEHEKREEAKQAEAEKLRRLREGQSKRRRRSDSYDEHDRSDLREKRGDSRRDDRFEGSRRRRNGEDDGISHTKSQADRKAYKALQPLVLYSIYEGSISKVMEYGAFVSFNTTEGRKEGLLHASDVSATRGKVLVISEFLRRGQTVKVKVVGIAGSKVSLSMREVDQETGEDLKPRVKNAATSDTREDVFKDEKEAAMGTSAKKAKGYGKFTSIKLDDDFEVEAVAKPRKQNLTSDLEKWEIQQLKASGIIANDEISGIAGESGDFMTEEDAEEMVEVEMQDNEPAFLKGQTTKTGAQLAPIKIVANPDGSLAFAAATSSALAKERRELRQAQEAAILDSIPKDMSRPWEDPNPEPGERTIAQALRGLGQSAYEMPEWKKMFIGKSVSYGQKSAKSITEQRMSLPIFKLKESLLEAIKNNQVLIVIGETGSGKTTQIPQYIVEAGYCTRGMLGCTQPRRVAAISISKRVAEEFGSRLGQEVGYAIRFEDCTSQDTVIKYMTDGMLLREALVDPILSRYSVVMLDEAHERTISTDVIFGLIKACIRKRPDFKLIVSSATMDAEKFSSYFFDSHIFTIPGRTFPVEILYTKEPESDYVEAALITVLQIHLCEPPGDILIFLTGQEEIDTACQTLHERMQRLEQMSPPPLIILPVYSALPSEMQTMIFDPAPPGCRKCVVATNIAEASLTIDGIFYVIDPGFAKVKMYNPKSNMDSLVVAPISQANARQRAGRAGRTGPGKCYRLYTEQAYRIEMLPTAVPEIQRTNLSNTVLLLKAMGINDMLNFDFMDQPPVQTLINSLEALYELNALDDEGLLTKLGRRMAEFPMEPNLSKMLITSVDLGCSDEIITIVAMLSVQNVFYRPRDKQAVADQKKAKFHQPEGDHITYLEVYRAWANNRFSNPWCFDNFVQSRALRRAQDVRKQLITIMDRYKFDIISCGKDYAKIRKAICAGFFRNACKRDPQEGYRTIIDHQQVYMHPSSAIYSRNPEWIVYHELVMTTKEYLRDCTTIEPQWLFHVAPNLFKKADDSKLSRRKQREKIEPLYNRYEEPNAWRLSRRRG